MQRQRSQSLPPPVRRPFIPQIPRPFGNGVALYDAPVYLHTSTFRSANLELSIRSPRVRHVNDPKWIGQSIPVFSGKDSIGGTVLTSIASNIATEHRLVISIEGAFFWSGPSPEEKDPTAVSPLVSSLPARLKHTFLSSLITISLLPDSHLSNSGSNSRGTRSRANSATAKIGSALQASIKRTFFGKGKHPPPAAANPNAYGYKRKRRNSETAQPTFTSTSDVKLSHAFSFPLPRENGPRSGEKGGEKGEGRPVPSSFSVSHVVQSGHRGRWYSESATVAYKIVVSVKPKSRERPRRAADGVNGVAPGVAYEETLEVPIFIEPEEVEPVPDSMPPESWTHHILHPAEPLEYACILSLPSPATFSRFARIPFYVFVTTQPKSLGLAQKLIKYATIRVTLIRRIHLDTGMTFPAPEPRTRHPDDPLSPVAGYAVDGVGGGGGSTSGDEGKEDWMGSRGRSGSGSSPGSLLRRMSSRTPKIFKWNRQQQQQKTQDPHTHSQSTAAAPESVGSARSTPNTLSSVSFPSTSQTHTHTTSRTSTSRTSKDKPLPLPPPSTAQIFEDTLSAVTAEEFPRRVARKSRRSSTQPEVIANSDGVLRADLVLNNELLNSVGWCGIGVDYFIEASVYYEDDILRIRAPVSLAGPYREAGTL